MDFIAEHYRNNIELDELFNIMTAKIGKEQVFLGIDIDIIKLLNTNDLAGIQEYRLSRHVEGAETKQLIRDSDGVIFVSNLGSDIQFVEHFTEDEVEKRMGLIIGAIANQPHECGALCRSKEKEGQPCSKLTFREHCHFHRDE